MGRNWCSNNLKSEHQYLRGLCHLFDSGNFLSIQMLLSTFSTFQAIPHCSRFFKPRKSQKEICPAQIYKLNYSYILLETIPSDT